MNNLNKLEIIFVADRTLMQTRNINIGEENSSVLKRVYWNTRNSIKQCPKFFILDDEYLELVEIHFTTQVRLQIITGIE